MRLQCPRCGNYVSAIAGQRVRCAECGFAATAPLIPGAPVLQSRSALVPFRVPPRPPTAARPEPSERRLAITALAVNVFLPGVGTLATGRRAEGWPQFLTFVLGVATVLWLVGLALIAGAWAWSVASSIVRIARAPTPPRAAPAPTPEMAGSRP